MPLMVPGVETSGCGDWEIGESDPDLGGAGPKLRLLPGDARAATRSGGSSAAKSKAPSSPWGLLVAQHCGKPRPWQSQEIDLLEQLAAQLAIAIQQAELYQKLEDANRELKRLASLDGLTLIPNRRRFDEYLECAWHRVASEQKPLSLILCDVDFFKLYNDTYGHQAGDFCLRKVATALHQAVERCLRRVGDWEADRVLEEERLFLVARYGGEEFAVILPEHTAEEAVRVAKAIRTEIAGLRLPHLKSVVSDYVTVSLGVACVVPGEESLPVELIAAADKALYQAKEWGRDRIAHLRVLKGKEEGNCEF